MIIDDEDGAHWLIEAGDPAREYGNLLARRGYHYQVLTRALICGTLSRGPSLNHAVSSPASRCDADVEGSGPAAVRLRDCLEELRRDA